MEPADAAAVPAPPARRKQPGHRPGHPRSCSTSPWPRTGLTDAAGQPLRFAPHDFRRLLITDAIMHGMPPHIAQLVAGHRDINTTMGYKAVYPEEVINGHRAFIARRRALRPSQEYRTPTDAEWEEFLGHFERRRVALGDCGRAYGTSCIHEHSCLTEMILVNFRRRGVRGVTVLTEGDREESWFAALAGVSPKMAAAFSPGRCGSARRSCGAARAFHRG